MFEISFLNSLRSFRNWKFLIICWGTTNQTLLQKVNVIHNRIVRYLTFSLPCSTAWPLYSSLKVLPLDILIQMEWGRLMFKFQNKMLPLAFENYFRKPNHNHATRFASSLNFEFVRANSSRDESMLRIIGPKAWVGVPLGIKKSPSLQVFTKDYRSFLINLKNQNLEWVLSGIKNCQPNLWELWICIECKYVCVSIFQIFMTCYKAVATFFSNQE